MRIASRITGIPFLTPYNEGFENQKYIIDNVVLPANGLISNGIDVLVEEEGAVEGVFHDGEALGS